MTMPRNRFSGQRRFGLSLAAILVVKCLQPAPVQASQINGGQSGRTPTPETRQSIRITTAQDGTGLDSPTSSASPGCGDLVKHSNSPPARSAFV